MNTNFKESFPSLSDCAIQGGVLKNEEKVEKKIEEDLITIFEGVNLKSFRCYYCFDRLFTVVQGI